MKTTKLILNSSVLIALVVPAAFAQQSGSSSTGSSTTQPAVQHRKKIQQDRIANGIQSGQLTAGETKKLETKEASVNKEVAGMRASNNGKLTSADRTKLQNQQNRLSKQIYTDKHNAATQHSGNGLVGQRKENQQDRIANGVRSGQLTAGETAKLENKQQGVNRTEAGMDQANGGKGTPAANASGDKTAKKDSHKNFTKKKQAAEQREVI